jgi:hypothetical protein|tara:strand:- start:347 stop:523 length:177 start_codon:yes stop_codon:yes gene_type:complete
MSERMKVLVELLIWAEEMYEHYNTISGDYPDGCKSEREQWYSVKRNLELKVLHEAKLS